MHLGRNNTKIKQDEIKLNKIEREADLQRRVAGADASSNKFQQILETVTAHSVKTAINAAVGIGKIQKASS